MNKKIRFTGGVQIYSAVVGELTTKGYWLPRVDLAEFEAGDISFEVNHKHKKMIRIR